MPEGAASANQPGGYLALCLELLHFQASVRLGRTSERCARPMTVARSRKASGALFAFSPASIPRLVCFDFARSVDQPERPFCSWPLVPKSEYTSLEFLILAASAA